MIEAAARTGTMLEINAAPGPPRPQRDPRAGGGGGRRADRAVDTDAHSARNFELLRVRDRDRAARVADAGAGAEHAPVGGVRAAAEAAARKSTAAGYGRAGPRRRGGRSRWPACVACASPSACSRAGRRCRRSGGSLDVGDRRSPARRSSRRSPSSRRAAARAPRSAAAALMNSRFLPMGVALAPVAAGRRRCGAPAQGQAVVDASWAIAARRASGGVRPLTCCSARPRSST